MNHHSLGRMTPSRRRLRRSVPRSVLPARTRGLLLGGLRLRLSVWWHAPELDEQLARGVDPIASDELSLRAGWLSSPKRRSLLARALASTVRFASTRPDVLGAMPPLIRRTEVLECRALLLALAEAVRDPENGSVQGLALASGLVFDGSSPLYLGTGSQSLAPSLHAALAALDETQPAP